MGLILPEICLSGGEEILQKTSKAKVFLDQALLGKLSPLQQKILIELSAGPQTLDVLSDKTGSSVYTIGKQLSLLQMRPSYNPLKGKGISTPLVKKQKDSGIKTTYFLAPCL